MSFRDYIQANRGRGAEIAAALGIPPSYLSQILSGHRSPSPKLCVQIEQVTEGVVRRWHLRPDWHLIWPELIGTEGAPPVPADVREVA